MMTDSLNDPLKSAELPKESTLENEGLLAIIFKRSPPYVITESDIQRWSFQKDRLISATPIDEKTQRSEREALSQYIQDLRSRHFDGLPLIEFPEDYGVWIDKLLLENRFEKSSLRFEDYFKKFCDLPIQDDSEKEKIEQELQSIDKLDEILRQKTNEAHQIQNETLSSIIQNNPFHYDEQNTIHTDLTLIQRKNNFLLFCRNELRDFKRKERLRRAMKIQNEETTSSLDSQNLPSNRHQWTPEDTSRSSESSKFTKVFTLPSVKALMENDDWMENPFDCDVCLEFLLPNSRSITCTSFFVPVQK